MCVCVCWKVYLPANLDLLLENVDLVLLLQELLLLSGDLHTKEWREKDVIKLIRQQCAMFLPRV